MTKATEPIDFIKYLERKKALATPETESHINMAIAVLMDLEQEHALAIIEFLLDYTLMEIRVGLGTIDVPDGVDEPDIEDLKFFKRVSEIYEEAAAGCYFCSQRVDPNEDEFSADSKLCFMCQKKLANFTQALGISAGRVFNGARSIQKTQIKVKP